MSTQMQARVIVTAGASGIGLAIAQRFSELGASVFICDISADALETAIRASPRLRGERADVSDPMQVEGFFAGAMDALGGVDVLVNNAGVGGPRSAVEDIEYDEWDACIRVNLSGMFYCTKQVIPWMKRQGGGCLLNISTTSARTGLPQRLPYVASKTGVLGFTHNLARELGPFQIRCNSILPGLIDNPRGRLLVDKLAAARGTTTEEAEAEYLRFISMRTWIQPREIADLACFLASDAARHITGQAIALDGQIEWEQ